MDPNLESMKLAAKLLCCANDSPGGDGYTFPGSGPVVAEGELDPVWQNFMDAFFAISDQILKRLI